MMRETLNYRRRGTILFGLVVAVAFFVAGGGWAAFAPIAGAAIATGQVSPKGARVPIQHLEGGIVEAVHVDDGDEVAAGAPLMVLRPIDAESEVETLRIRLRTLAAEAERLRAERDGDDSLAFSHPSLADAHDPVVAELRAGETKRFRSRQAAIANEVDLRRQQIDQTREQIAGYEVQLEGTREQLGLIDDEIVGVAELYEKKLVPLARLLALKREKSNLSSEVGRLEAAIAEADSKIAELELEVVGIERRQAVEVETRLAEVETKLAETEVALGTGLDKLERTVLRAAAAGTVMNLSAGSVGAVVKPGETVMEVVPADKDLVIDVELNPQDIESVNVGQTASVVFPGLSARDLKRLTGTVTWVAADAVEDERSGRALYEASVRLDAESAALLPEGVELKPGMPAEVYIETGTRTFLEYAAEPFVASFDRALRE
jgi:HlyD family type I secretion membrane fusion protein